MPSEQQFSSGLSEFARTLVTDFPMQGILDHLAQRIVDVLPITAAGVTLISPDTDPRYVAASNESALLFEELQPSSGRGRASWPVSRTSRSSVKHQVTPE